MNRALGTTVVTVLLATGAGGCGPRLERVPPRADGAGETANALTSAERSSGWRLLFDGRTTDGWHGYGRRSAEGWLVENGTLRGTAGSGDLLTDAEYESFELSVEWKLDPGGNSGIFFRVVEDPARFRSSGFSGPEYQLIDDSGWPTPLEEWQHTGSNYAIQPPVARAARPVGEWNTSRLVVDGPRVEHWLNGVKILEYEMWSGEWEGRLRASRYSDRPAYGRARSGRIALQDHGGKARFRNVKIRAR